MRSRLSSRSDVELIEIGNVMNQILRDKLIDQLLSQTVDLHRTAAGPVEKCFFNLGWTGSVHAAPDRFTFSPEYFGVTRGTALRHFEWPPIFARFDSR